MKLFKILSDYRWPIYLGGLLTMSVVSSGVIAWVATRADTERPMQGYYEAARAWDASEAVAEASRQLGWSVRYEFPSDVPHIAGMPRPVDVHIADRDGKAVQGLSGHLFAIRPSDTRLNRTAELTAEPQAPGTYRTLLIVDAPGEWELRLDVRQAAMRFVHAARVRVAADQAPAGGEQR